jgi:hypothetical protein
MGLQTSAIEKSEQSCANLDCAAPASRDDPLLLDEATAHWWRCKPRIISSLAILYPQLTFN